VEIITNKFLRRITLSPIESLYVDQMELYVLDESAKLEVFKKFKSLSEFEKFKEFEKLEELERLKESEKVKMIDESLNKESIQMYLNLLSTNDEIRKLLADAKSNEEKNVILELVSLHFYFSKKSEITPRLKAQLRQCNDIIKSDICIRNKKLKNEATIEAEKLQMAIDTDWVYYAINRLDQLYSQLNPSLNSTDRYIQISETMHYISLYSRERFFTIEEAKDYVKRKDNKSQPFGQTYKTLIKDRIKIYIWKVT
jgi:hypothetical protein